MRTKPIVILTVLLSLLFQQAMGFAMMIPHSADESEHDSGFVTDSVHQHDPAGQTSDNCHSDLFTPHVFCCAISASACCTLALPAENISPAFQCTSTWPFVHFGRFHDWSPDIEPRPPRFIS